MCDHYDRYFPEEKKVFVSKGPSPTSKEIYDALRDSKLFAEGAWEADFAFSQELKKQKERIEGRFSDPVLNEMLKKHIK